MNIYLIVKQGKDFSELRSLFDGPGKNIIPIFQHDVQVQTKYVGVTDFLGNVLGPRLLPFWSLEAYLPQKITTCSDYKKMCDDLKCLKETVLKDTNCHTIIWTFPFHIDCMGMYHLFLNELRTRNINMYLISDSAPCSLLTPLMSMYKNFVVVPLQKMIEITV